MSALPPKADIGTQSRNVRFRPETYTTPDDGHILRKDLRGRCENARTLLEGSRCHIGVAPVGQDRGRRRGHADQRGWRQAGARQDYTKETGNQVKYAVGSPLIVSKRLADAEVFDVIVQSAPAMDDYAKLGGVNVDARVRVARGGIGMAIRKDAIPPDISTLDAFKKAIMDAKSIAMTDTAMPNGSGILTQLIFNDAGVMDAIKSKIKVVGLDPGQEQIAKGEIEIGFFNISEIRSFVKFAGAVPGSLQKYTNYDAAVTTKSTATQAAAALVRMIASPTSAVHWKSAGMEPAH